MDQNLTNGIVSAFKFICVLLATSMTLYCVNDFLKDEDTTTVSYQIFNQANTSPYPQFTMCVVDFSLEYEFGKKIGIDMDWYGFRNFYSGNLWDDKMINLDRKEMVSRLEEDVIATCVKGYHDNVLENECEEKGFIAAFVGHNGWKCFSFHYLKPKQIKSASFWIKRSYLSGVNVFSFPKQMLNLNNRWIKNTMKVNSTTDFYLVDYEVYRHRNKTELPCLDSKMYDLLIMERIYIAVGCTPFYADKMKHLPNCTTKEELKMIYDMTESKSSFDPPCNELKRYTVTPDSVTVNSNITMENAFYPGIVEKLVNVDGWSRITIHLRENTYKDIQQTRAYSVQNLIGNAGGYIGMFIGYAILDIPSLINWMYKKAFKTI